MPNLYTPYDAKRFSEDGYKAGEGYRTEYRRDYERLLHSFSFRRLQGKTQIFPPFESDYFRNRLSHSLEVAQIAKSIVKYLNKEYKSELEGVCGEGAVIDEDIVEFAGLAHDIGHSPFGHNGEEALNKCMEGSGGFEGNAQTLRILTKLEKKERGEGGNSFGLNLTYRSLAAVLKYDGKLSAGNEKGYYDSEEEIVKKIKENVAGKGYSGNFKTIECQIMDIADDIAYSTYDIEDIFKAGFLSPFEMLEGVFDKDAKLANKIAKGFNNKYYDAAKARGLKITEKDVKDVIISLFKPITSHSDNDIAHLIIYRALKTLSVDAYSRKKFTSLLVDYFIRGIILEINTDYPCLSRARLKDKQLIELEVLKQFTYFTIIESPMVRVTYYRGFKIVKALFDAFNDVEREGYNLLPKSWQARYKASSKEFGRKRIICDFIAGMTDRYALEFYGRLHSERPETIFKPLN